MPTVLYRQSNVAQQPQRPDAQLGLAIYDQPQSFESTRNYYPEEPLVDRRGRDWSNVLSNYGKSESEQSSPRTNRTPTKSLPNSISSNSPMPSQEKATKPKPRRNSLSQAFARSRGVEKKRQPSEAQPLPLGAAATAALHSKREASISFSPNISARKGLDQPQRPATADATTRINTTGRRPSLFQMLRKSFSKSPSEFGSPNRKSSVETVRKLSRSSDRRQSDRPIEISARQLAHSIVASARTGTGSPANSRRFGSDESGPKASPNQPWSARVQIPPSPLFTGKYNAPAIIPKLNHLRAVPTHHVTLESPKLMERTPSVSSVDSMYDLYQDDSQAPTPSMNEESLPPSADPSMVSVDASLDSSLATPCPEEEGQPAWAGSEIFGSSFINPWSSKIQARPSTISEADTSPGGRRSSIASSRFSDRKSRHSQFRDSKQFLSDVVSVNGQQIHSMAVERRASLAANIRELNQPDFRAASPNSMASSKKRANPPTHNNTNLIPVRPQQARKPSLVLPGDPRLLQRRKSSLSVSFSPMDSERQPLPPLPAVSRRSYFDGGADDYSVSSSSARSSEAGDSPASDDSPTTFFQLRNPWTGLAVDQPHSGASGTSTPSGGSRRPTILPTTPKSAKSLSISSMQTGDEWRSRDAVKVQPGHPLSGFRVSIDTNAFSSYTMA